MTTPWKRTGVIQGGALNITIVSWLVALASLGAGTTDKVAKAVLGDSIVSDLFGPEHVGHHSNLSALRRELAEQIHALLPQFELVRGDDLSYLFIILWWNRSCCIINLEW